MKRAISLAKIPILWLLLCHGYSLSAQLPSKIAEHVHHNTVERYAFGQGPASYLLADDVSFRACPGTDCKVLAQLPIGTPLFLLEESKDSLRLNGIQSPWYKVTVDGKTGWVWGGMIAQFAFGSQADPTVKFVAGPERLEWTEGEYGRWVRSMQVRAFRGTQQLDKIVVKCPAFHFGGVTNNGACGLKNVSDIIAVNVACSGGCGCLTGDMLWVWNGSKFLKFADTFGTPDAEFSEGEGFVFPTDMNGIPGTIIKTKSYAVKDEETPKGKLERVSIQEFFVWNGSKLVPSGRAPIKKTTLIDFEH